MDGKYKIRTDLALELKEEALPSQGVIDGVLADERYYKNEDARVTRVEIINKNGSKKIGKPIGTYITIESKKICEPNNISKLFSVYLQEMINDIYKDKKIKSILVVGLGNRYVTPDALGPITVEGLEICDELNAIAPGVLGQTGMETASVIKGVVHENKPDLLIVVDALAARNAKRLNKTIQLTNTGIQPGSGIGNNRQEINSANMKVPVIAIGVPTVVEAATIVNDTFSDLLNAMSLSHLLNDISEREKYYFVKEIMRDELADMYVTPKEVDETIRNIATTIADAINLVPKGINMHKK